MISRRTLMLIVVVLVGLAIWFSVTHTARAQSDCSDLPCIVSVGPLTDAGSHIVGFSNGAVIETFDGAPSGGKVQSYERTDCWLGWCGGVQATDINGFSFSGDFY